MADNLTTTTTVSTIPNGTVISTDDAGAGGHVQRVKLAVSADGSITHIGATADGMYMQGPAAENAAAAGNPVLIGGRYDATPRTLGDADAGAIALDADGAVQISDGGNSITIDGTIAATQSGTWNITNISGTVSLPTGAATAANQSTANTSLSAIQTAVEGTLTVGSHAVTNAGTFAVQEDGPALTALQLIDDAIYTDDIPFAAGSNKVMAVGFRFDDVAVSNVTEGDVGYGRMSSRREIYTTIRDAAGNERGLNVDASGNITVNQAGTVTVDGSGVTQPISAASLPLPAGASTAANQTTIIGHVDGIEALLTTIDADTSNLSVVGGGTEATALRMTLASDSTGLLSVDDNGGSLTIDNTNLDNLHSADFDTGVGTDTTPAIGIAVPASGGAAIITGDVANGLDVDVTRVGGTVTVDGSGVTQPISAASLPLPTGAATAANQLPDGHNVTVDNAAGASAVNIQDGGNSITVDNAGTFAVQSTLQANSGTDIGDVDVTSVVPGTAATNLGKAIDTAAGATDTGVAVLAVRDDALTTLTPIDGDYVPLRVSSTGALHVTGGGGGTQYNVDDAGPTVVTMAGVVRDDSLTTLTEVDGDATLLRVNSVGALHVTGGGGGTEYTDDTSTHATGSTVGSAMMAVAVPTDSAVDANDLGVPAMSLDRRLYTDTQIVGQDVDITIADGGNSITVDGTITETNSAAILADTAAMDTNLATIAGAVAAGQMQVDIVADGAGLATAANQLPDGHNVTVDNAAGAAAVNIQDGGNSITVDNAGTFAVQVDGGALTALQKIDDPVLVDDAAFTPATSSVMMAGFEYDDTLPDSVDEGDAGAARMSANRNIYMQIRDAAGNERGANVNASNELTVVEANSTAILADTANIDTNLGTVAGAVAGTEMQVDVVAALPAGDNNIGNVDIASSVALDVSAATVTVDSELTTDDFDTGVGTDTRAVVGLVLAESGGGALVGSANPMPVDGSGVTQPVSGTVTANLGATDNAVLDSIDANTGFGLVVGGGVEATALRVTLASDSTGVLSVDDGGGALTVDGTVTASNTAGDVAHDGADSGNPVKVGFKAIAHSANPTAVAAGDRTDWYANRHGIPFVIGGHPNVQTVQLNVTDTDGAQTNTAIITVGASTKIVVTMIAVAADNANTVDVQCRVGFGLTTTPANDAADVILSHPGIAPGSGMVIGSGAGIIGIGADNEDLRITCTDPTGGNLDIVVSYYTIES